MNTESLKNRLTQEFKDLVTRIEEKEAYQRLKEKWESLNSLQKKIFLGLSILIFFSFVLISPLLTWLDSEDFLEEFEAKQELIRTLSVTQKDLSESPQNQNSLNLIGFRSQIENQILSEGFLPDQFSSLTPLSTSDISKIFPPQIIEGGFEFDLYQVTIRQLNQVANRLDNLGSQVKVRDIKVVSDPLQAGYLNATIKVLLLQVKEIELELPTEINPPKREKR